MIEATHSPRPPAPTGRWPARRAFSLMEITLVLAIIGVLMAVAAVNIVGAAKRANVRATEASLETIGSALDSYFLENGSAYPPDLRALVEGEFLEPSGMTDAWNNDFYYVPTQTSQGDPYQLLSGGPDGQVGTEDDIDYWAIQQQQ